MFGKNFKKYNDLYEHKEKDQQMRHKEYNTDKSIRVPHIEHLESYSGLLNYLHCNAFLFINLETEFLCTYFQNFQSFIFCIWHIMYICKF